MMVPNCQDSQHIRRKTAMHRLRSGRSTLCQFSTTLLARTA
jgi:hypothetical protein